MSTKPLTSAESRAGLKATSPKLADALARGDREAFTALKIDEEWFTRSLEEAEARESREVYERAKAERDAKKPAALAAAKIADPREYFSEESAKIKQGIELLCDAYRTTHKRLPMLREAHKTARALCEEAGVPFLEIGPAHDTAAKVYAEVIADALVAAKLPDDGLGGYAIPTISIGPRKAGW
jgi:hypothetical protein